METGTSNILHSHSCKLLEPVCWEMRFLICSVTLLLEVLANMSCFEDAFHKKIQTNAVGSLLRMQKVIVELWRLYEKGIAPSSGVLPKHRTKGKFAFPTFGIAEGSNHTKKRCIKSEGKLKIFTYEIRYVESVALKVGNLCVSCCNVLSRGRGFFFFCF